MRGFDVVPMITQLLTAIILEVDRDKPMGSSPTGQTSSLEAVIDPEPAAAHHGAVPGGALCRSVRSRRSG